jgi:UDP-glucose 4-epimerase
MKILVTGGAGFIGSHTVVELLEAGHEVVIVDNLCNSSKKSLARVKRITGKTPAFYKVDIRDEKKLNAVLDKEGPFAATIHFAALKAVGGAHGDAANHIVANVLRYLCHNGGTVKGHFDGVEQSGKLIVRETDIQNGADDLNHGTDVFGHWGQLL